MDKQKYIRESSKPQYNRVKHRTVRSLVSILYKRNERASKRDSSGRHTPDVLGLAVRTGLDTDSVSVGDKR